MKYIAAFVCICVFLFAMFAFVRWDTNPGEWPEKVRFSYGFLVIVTAITIAGIQGIKKWK